MRNELKTNRFPKTALIVTVFFLLSQATVFAVPEQIGGGSDNRPGISPNDVNPGGSNSLPDGNANFFDGGSGLFPKDGPIVLSASERVFVQDLFDRLPASGETKIETTNIQREPPGPVVGTVEKTIETLQRRMEESSKSGNILTRPYSFSPFSKQENKSSAPALIKKMKFAEHEDKEAQEMEPETALAPEVMPVIHPEQVVLDMKLEVTPEVVKAAEDLNFTADHPWLGWLAMKNVPQEVKEIVSKAETQRKVMMEAAKEAAKNGKKIIFIVNKKALSFYFNFPLFAEGDYELLILDDKSAEPKPPVPVE